MALSLLDLQNFIASEIDQSATAPSQGGTDWNIRLNALNRALFDWSESYDWKVLKKQFNGLISTSTGNASIALPSGFRKLDGLPKIAGDEYTPVDVSYNSNYVSNDKVINLLGNDKDARTLYVPLVTLSSGASVQFNYFASAVSLASATNLTECPDPTYLIQRALYYIYKGREDGRFPEAKVEADRILMRMIENENTFGVGHSENRVPKMSFRIGRD